MENRTKVSNDTIFSDLQRLGEIFTDTKHRAASLRQLSFLFSYLTDVLNHFLRLLRRTSRDRNVYWPPLK